MNTFNRLFSELVNPKLLKLLFSVNKFYCLKDEITSFIESLNGVSSYLDKFNPAQELLKLIREFSGDKYAQEVRSHIQTLLEELEKLDVKKKYEEIIGHLRSLATEYNRSLEFQFKNFKRKIEGHKTSLEKNIQKYIFSIRYDLSYTILPVISRLISIIDDNIKSLEENNNKLGQFKDEKPEKLMKSSKNGSKTELNDQDMNKLKEIVETHKKYKQCLKKCYSQITKKLNLFTRTLRYYNAYILMTRNSLYKYSDSVTDSTNIGDKLIYLIFYENSFSKFDKNMMWVEKLDEIGKHIKTMKSTLIQVKDQVKPEAESYINGLQNISIKHSEVQSSIDNIKKVNESVINMLKIAKSTIDFYNSLQGEISKLDVDFYYHDNIDYLERDLLRVREKVALFDTAIKSKLCSVMTEINKFKEKSQEATTAGGTCAVKRQEEGENDLISPVLHCIDVTLKDIPNIIKLIDESSEDIKMIKYMLEVLEYNKNQSGKISEINSIVSGITNLKDAPKTLTEAVKDLNKFVILQEDTKFWIDQFSKLPKFRTLDRYSKPLQEIIEYSKMVIAHINYYIGYLKTVGYSNYLIRWIKTYYESRFEAIKGIIQNFKGYVIEISTKLGIINSNLFRLKWLQCRICIQYNLWRLKRYMKYLKIYVRNIRISFDVISRIIDKVKKETSYFGIYKSELQSLVKFIECYICYINCQNKENNNDLLKESVVKQLEGIKDKINDTISVMIVINSIKSSKCIESIEGKLKSVESSVDGLECAIEGVVRNPIRCSIQSTSNHLINHNMTTNWNRQINNTTLSHMNIVIINLMSRIVIDESIFVMSMLNMYSKIKSEISKVLPMLQHCICIKVFEQYYINSVCPYHKSLPDLSDTDTINWEMVQNDVHNKENDSCSCMIIRYRLIPEVYLIIRYSGYFYFDLLTTLDRQFNKYVLTEYDQLFIFKLVYLVIHLIHKITLCMRYLYEDDVRQGYCFCNRFDKSFIHLKLIIIKICELMENIWSMDPEIIKVSIEKLSTLMSQLDKIDSDVSKNTSNNSNSLNLLSKIIVASFDVTNISTGLIFESVTFLGYYFRLIIALLPTQSLTVILIYQYLFNIIFSINNLGFRIHNLYRILKLSVNTIISNFVLIGKLFNSDGIKCDCKNKICPCKIIILTSSKIIDEKIIWVKKNVLNNNRLYNIKESKNYELKKKFVESNNKYNELGITLVKNTSIIDGTGLDNLVTDVTSVRNWGYDTRYEHEHQPTNNIMANNCLNLLNTGNYYKSS